MYAGASTPPSSPSTGRRAGSPRRRSFCRSTRSDPGPLPLPRTVCIIAAPFRRGLGGQGHVREKSSCQEKGARRQEKAGQESFFCGQPTQQGQAQDSAQAVRETGEVSKENERQEGLDQAGCTEGPTQTIREEDDRNPTTQKAGLWPAAADSFGVETDRSARRSASAQRWQRPQRPGEGLYALSTEARRGLHEQGSTRTLPPVAAGVEARADGRSRPHDVAHEGRRGELSGSQRSRDAGVRVWPRAAHSR